ncbi:MAG: nucleoside-diphosphate kinase [Tannerella sp.]|jgi:nucleoside-diphosphate kinase|nr:nucleoside-diphosphate kinase [Tannerella sp.]
MEKTLLILKPSAIQRGLIGEVTLRMERKGLRLSGMKMMMLNDEILDIHYSHLKEKACFPDVKNSMKRSPVIVQCWEGVDATNVVRKMTGKTNGRDAEPGTIRGDFSVSIQENIVHTSDCREAAEIELKRFFRDEELFDYKLTTHNVLYAPDEL